MKFLSTQEICTLDDIRRFINKETHATINEMFHFLKNQIEVTHKSILYKYLHKELKLKIESLKLLLDELLSDYEISIFKSSREYLLPNIPDQNDYGDTELYDEKSHFLLEDIQINSLKFPRPKFNISNKFPLEKFNDVSLLKRMMMSSEQNKSMYPEFDVKLEKLNENYKVRSDKMNVLRKFSLNAQR